MAGFKLKVVEFILEHEKCAASRKFDEDKKCVRQWCTQKEALKSTSSKKRAFRGKPCKFPESEELLCYVMEVRNNGYALTTDMLRMRAQAMAHAKSILHDDVKASAGWVRRFLKWKGLSFQQRTTLLPAASR